MNECYAGRISRFIENLGFGNGETKYIPLKRVRNIKFPRD